MPATKNSSSSPDDDHRLLRIPLSQLHAHPLNANVMSAERKQKLAANIVREGRYPPLIVRPHPFIVGEYQTLDGHQRIEVLRQLGHDAGLCYLWPCDDAAALLLLATLNRLEGEDVPARRASLLDELSGLLPLEDIALLLPESADQINETLALLNLDSAALLAELEAAGQAQLLQGPRLISFAVERQDEEQIEAAVTQATLGLTGLNKRGRALAQVCREYLRCGDE